MQKRNRNRKMKGGFLDSISQSLSSGWNSLSQGASSAWNKAKSATTTPTTTSTSYTPMTSPTTTPMTSPTTTPMTSPTMGGRRRRTRKMRGGFRPNSSTTNLAFAASPISGIKTAQPHNWVGGKTKRRRHSRHRKHL